MDEKKIRICLFIHFSNSKALHHYVNIYIRELTRHFDKVKVLTNNSKLQEQKSPFNSKVSFKFMENKGYDFGMFYRFIKQENLEDFSEIAVVNDSNILFNKLDHIFDWGRNNNSDFWGIIDSNEKPWFSGHPDNYHIQSHFLVLKTKAIAKLSSFFESIDIDSIFKETNPKKLRRLVINNWEIGLTQYLINSGLEVDSFIDTTQFDNSSVKIKNLTHSHFHELAGEGYSFLKKKVANKKRKWFQTENGLWKETLIKYGNHDWNMERIIQELD